MPHVGLDALPVGVQPIVLGILFAVAVLQWAVTLPIVLRLGIFRSLSGKRDLVARVEKPENVKPFTKDVFYIIWNLLPIVLLVAYFYSWFHWASWDEDLRTHLGAEYGGIVQNLDAFFLSPFLAAALALSALYSAFIAQPKKQRSFEADATYLYWWDIRISRTIFRIRQVALAFNLFTVLLVSLTILKIILMLTLAAFECSVQPALLHPDGMGGLGAIGEMAQVVAVTCLIISGAGIVAALDHKKQGLAHRVGDLLFLFMFVPTIWVMTVPLIAIHGKLLKAYRPMEVVARERGQRLFESLGPTEAFVVVQEDPDGTRPPDPLEKWYTDHESDIETLEARLTKPRFPLDLASGLSLLVSWLLPVIFYIGKNFYGRRRDDDAEVAT